MEGARRIAAGDLSLPVVVPPTNDEISFLAAEFDRMRARVAASQGRLIEQLEESEQRRLESERLAAIGTLASSLAHEIRNPLNAVSLLLAQLERSKQPDEQKRPFQGQDGTGRQMFDDMRAELGRLDRLVSDILDYARPIQLQKETININAFMESIATFYKGLFETKHIVFKLQVPSRSTELSGDRDKLRQAFVNVIKNAVEAMPQGGRLDVVVEILDRGVRFTIRDSGVGIDPTTKGRLFDLFFTTKEQGTGLGLSMVKKIIDAHGGKIDIQSSPGQGTTISFNLPKSL
jgi:signal transduction histidine kinase